MKTYDDISSSSASASASRRDFLRHASLGLGGILLGTSGLAGSLTGLEASSFGPASLEAWQAGKQLNVALVGLGKYSTGQLAPALQETKLCRLAGIVTGSPEKVPVWKAKYNIPDKNVYDYKSFDRIIDNPDIDIVYVVLPIAMHAEYTIRALQAGKHVICEKPMAMTPTECRQMIDAAKKAGKKFSIGYRLHFEPHNMEMMRLGQKEIYGPIKRLVADNGYVFNNDTPWRVDKELAGGGPLVDLGIYCVQGVVYTKGQIPASVTAKFTPKPNNGLFKEVEAGVNWQFQFADGSVADCRTSYAESLPNRLQAEAAKGKFELSPAFGYGGIKGTTSKGPMNIQNVNQQALQMDNFADCILNNKPTRVPGEMGLRDVQLMAAIYRAAETGQKVSTKDVQNIIDRTNSR
ncbi:glucose-fructose oxidoreductase [Hymenobacter qilianensis]|uniref:Glucose-fructose oxidoreductase n=2 Tax=Hymenobacter qilianensis TaxID=1385715 RepID=A0ACB5PWK8_9BACT|nr:Gfo/Idh/MocA family oxidoreductase [Hymenobacter qilianensis]QNP51066.1 Gfo/Idh/MocA family oxidoreductase [Hymenobacter qilianensis]GGF78669.1 glucose-fructose oxidoreductase [Hymenobacter qilianensis]